MTQITTTGGMITFQDTVTGLAKQIGQNQLWLQFSEIGDTVNFLRVSIPTDGSDGTPFWSTRAVDLTIDGETYTIEQLKSGAGLDGLFSTMSFSYEIVEELPEEGEPNVIYLVYDDETGTYIEYLWLSNEQVYEELGSVSDVDLGNYYTKSQTDTLLSAKADSSSLSTVATSGSYSDLSNTPNLATVATSGSYSDLSNTPTIPTVPTNVSAFNNDAGYLTEHQSLSDYYTKSQTDNLLNGKQATLVSGTNLKTINNESLLGSGNITISGGGSGVTVDSTWIPNSTNPVESQLIQSSLADKANSSSLAAVATSGTYGDLSGKPTNVSTFTNDAGYLTSHQSLADVFGDVLYDSQTKHINFYGKGDTSHTTVLAYVDAANFIVDGMVDTVEVKNATVSGQTVLCLVISFNTDAGKQDINIPISQIFDATNYYTKSETDTLLSGKASTSSLATVATTGAYSDLTGTPTIPAAQVNSDWNASSGVAEILNKPTIPTVDSTLTQGSTNAAQSGATYTALGNKQDTLVSGTNIKTINNESILGSGNITISGGSAQVQSDWNQSDSTAVDYIKNKPTIPVVDQSLDTQSTNAISNSTVATAIGDIATALAIINGTTPSNP